MIDRRVAFVALLAGLVTVLPVGCGSSGGGSSGDTGAPSTTAAVASTIAHLPAGPTAPSFVPVGFQPLSSPDHDIAVAIPGSWQITPVNGRVVEAGGIDLERVDPQLGGLLRQVGGYLGNAVSIAGIDRNLATQGRGALLTQSRVVVPSVPQAMVSQVQTWLTSIGAGDIRISRITVPGLDPSVQAVRFDTVITRPRSAAAVGVVLVPATRGLAVAAVRAPAASIRGVLATLAAR